LLHQLRLFSNREYEVLLIRDRANGELAHYSGATGRYWRWPFMGAEDMQIGDTWTNPAHRGRGLGKFALAVLLRQLARPGRRIWYVVGAENLASIAIAKAAGMRLGGTGGRTHPRLFRFLHAYELRAAAGPSRVA
jgi:RimJ/RimL family protein N-acetyltransferase